jgi:GTPase SAR1 family protein
MGQGGVGKTAMVLRYTTGDFNEQVRARAAVAIAGESVEMPFSAAPLL